jgi:hypothetical protein
MPPQAAGVLPFGEQSVDLPRQGRASLEHLLRAPPQSTSSEHLLFRGDGRYRVHPGTQSLLAHGARGGDPVRVPRGLRHLFAEARRPCHPTQTPSPPRSCPATNKAWCAASRCARPRPRSPLVLGLLDLVAEDVAVGAHETKVRPQIHSTSFLCRSSTSAT